MGWSRALVAAIVCAATACSLSLDGYTGGDAGAGPAAGDAAPDADAASLAESGVTPPGSSGEAGTDAGVLATCLPNAVFCDDFERSTLLADKGWTLSDPPLEISSAQSRSPSRSFHAPDDPGSSVTTVVPNMPFRFLLSVDVFIDHVPAENAAEILKLLVGDPTANGYSVGITAEDGAIKAYVEAVQGGTHKSDYELMSPAGEAYGTGWHRVVFDVDRSAASSITVSPTWDGTPTKAAVVSMNPNVDQNVVIDIGFTYREGTTGTWDFFLDDISLAPR